MHSYVRPLALLLLGAAPLSACNGGDQTDSSAATDVSTTGTTPSTATATTTTDLPTSAGATTGDPTSTPGATTTTADPTTTTADPTSDPTTTAATHTTTDPGDTDAPALACPLADQPGVTHLGFTPDLFSAGADPSKSPACQIKNPERGFHGYVDLRDLDDDTLDGVAAAGWTVVYGQILIPEYRDKALDDALFTQIKNGFDLVRAHGMKVVPRFHYSDDVGEPDATLQRILGHIDQLAPILQQHGDVILNLHAGFIGAYGEWHSSTNGLDAPGPRKQILDALLAALPADRTISVRRPSFKRDAYAGPLTDVTAHDGSALARIGHINDCFLASDDDEGTYQEPGEKDYMISDAAFVPVGGETCKVNPPRSECPAALAELGLLHWTHLNSAYHPGVLASWKDGGCFDTIACRLGYRLAVTDLRHAATATADTTVAVQLDILNDGFAAPVNPRPLTLVFAGPDQQMFEATLADFDLRTLQPGEPRTLCLDAHVPPGVGPGAYRIGLRLTDPAPNLTADPRQAIRLANDIEWQGGINWFDATIDIQ